MRRADLRVLVLAEADLRTNPGPTWLKFVGPGCGQACDLQLAGCLG